MMGISVAVERSLERSIGRSPNYFFVSFIYEAIFSMICFRSIPAPGSRQEVFRFLGWI